MAGGVTLAVGAVGWLAGPSVGGWVFGRTGMRGVGKRGEFRAVSGPFNFFLCSPFCGLLKSGGCCLVRK